MVVFLAPVSLARQLDEEKAQIEANQSWKAAEPIAGNLATSRLSETYRNCPAGQ